jgi:hypothetical protein
MCVSPQGTNLDSWCLKTGYRRKGEEVTEGWRKLDFEEICNMNCSPDIIRKMFWAGHVTHREHEKFIQTLKWRTGMEDYM